MGDFEIQYAYVYEENKCWDVSPWNTQFEWLHTVAPIAYKDKKNSLNINWT